MSGPYRIDKGLDGDEDWKRHAACADRELVPDRSIFFADEGRSGAAKVDVACAKMICANCDVQVTCLEYALEQRLHWIWGGTTEKQRRVILRRRALVGRISA